jgi:hypothetical protein
MGNLETKATLGYDIVQWQANEEEQNTENWKVFLNIQSNTKLAK